MNRGSWLRQPPAKPVVLHRIRDQGEGPTHAIRDYLMDEFSNNVLMIEEDVGGRSVGYVVWNDGMHVHISVSVKSYDRSVDYAGELHRLEVAESIRTGTYQNVRIVIRHNGIKVEPL